MKKIIVSLCVLGESFDSLAPSGLALRANLRLLYLALALALGCGQIQAATVEAEGRALGDMKTAREQALADALREAVRIGTGVDVLSSTGVSDFTLEYDRILASAFGHVKSYKVLDSGLGPDGIYRVRVSAEVQKGAPEAKNTLALRQLVLLKNSPRLAIRISGPEGQTASALLEESARDLQIQIVPPGTPGDFEITGDLTLRHTGRETLHGSPPQNVFTLQGALRAIKLDTGEVLAIAPFEASRKIPSPLPELPEARQDALERALRPPETDGVPSILGKILARWVTETDLGAIKRLEFSGINSDDFQKIQTDFADTEKVSAVWPREFDSQGLSVLDVETRLDNIGLGQEITKATAGRMKLDRSTENLLAFNASGTGSAAPAAGAQGDAPAGDKPWWKVW
jgi:hypothetical protein